MSQTAARHASHVARSERHRPSAGYTTERDRLDAARLRPLKWQRRREQLRENAAFFACSGVVLAFATYVTTTR